MAAIKAGDRVKVVSREVTNEDSKSGLYYSYFGGLTGSVDRIYDDGSVCIDVDLDSLSDEIRTRHLAMQETEQQRWLSSLSDEVRNRLTAEQKQLKMSYRILVSKNDLEPIGSGKPRGSAKDQHVRNADSSSDPTKSSKASGSSSALSQSPTEQLTVQSAKTKPSKGEPLKRLSEADLAAAEEAFLRSRLQRS
jgi:hypothetical protein